MSQLCHTNLATLFSSHLKTINASFLLIDAVSHCIILQWEASTSTHSLIYTSLHRIASSQFSTSDAWNAIDSVTTTEIDPSNSCCCSVHSIVWIDLPNSNTHLAVMPLYFPPHLLVVYIPHEEIGDIANSIHYSEKKDAKSNLTKVATEVTMWCTFEVMHSSLVHISPMCVVQCTTDLGNCTLFNAIKSTISSVVEKSQMELPINTCFEMKDELNVLEGIDQGSNHSGSENVANKIDMPAPPPPPSKKIFRRRF